MTALNYILKDAKRISQDAYLSPKVIEWYRTFQECPPYPVMPNLQKIHEGLIGKIDENGLVKALICIPESSQKNYILRIQVEGYLDYRITQVQYILNKEKGLHPLPFAKSNDTIFYQPKEKGEYIFVISLFDNVAKQTDSYISDNRLSDKSFTVFLCRNPA